MTCILSHTPVHTQVNGEAITISMSGKEFRFLFQFIYITGEDILVSLSMHDLVRMRILWNTVCGLSITTYTVTFSKPH